MGRFLALYVAINILAAINTLLFVIAGSRYYLINAALAVVVLALGACAFARALGGNNG
jgi:hypothetical protein